MQSDTVFDAIFRERLVPARVRELGTDERSRLRLQGRRAAALQQTAASGWRRRLRSSPPASPPFHPPQQPASSRNILLTHAVCSGAQWLDADDLRVGGGGGGEGGQFR